MYYSVEQPDPEETPKKDIQDLDRHFELFNQKRLLMTSTEEKVMKRERDSDVKNVNFSSLVLFRPALRVQVPSD